MNCQEFFEEIVRRSRSNQGQAAGENTLLREHLSQCSGCRSEFELLTKFEEAVRADSSEGCFDAASLRMWDKVYMHIGDEQHAKHRTKELLNMPSLLAGLFARLRVGLRGLPQLVKPTYAVILLSVLLAVAVFATMWEHHQQNKIVTEIDRFDAERAFKLDNNPFTIHTGSIGQSLKSEGPLVEGLVIDYTQNPFKF